MSQTLSRPVNNRIIAGVCAGLAARFGLPPAVVRAGFLLSCLLPGPQVLLYVVLIFVIPSEG